MFGRACLRPRPYFGRTYDPPGPASAVTTSRSVVQLPCGSMRIVNVRPCSSIAGGRRRRDARLAPERLALVAEAQLAVLDGRASYVPSFLSASLTSNRSAKSLRGVDPDHEVDRLVARG